MSDQVKIILDPSVAKDWTEIDAIKLIGRGLENGERYRPTWASH